MGSNKKKNRNAAIVSSTGGHGSSSSKDDELITWAITVAEEAASSRMKVSQGIDTDLHANSSSQDLEAILPPSPPTATNASTKGFIKASAGTSLTGPVLENTEVAGTLESSSTELDGKGFIDRKSTRLNSSHRL